MYRLPYRNNSFGWLGEELFLIDSQTDEILAMTIAGVPLTIPQYEQEITTRTQTQIQLQNNRTQISLSDILAAITEANRLRAEFTTAYLSVTGAQAREIEIHIHVNITNAQGRTQIDLTPDIASVQANRIIFIIGNQQFGFSPSLLQADFARYSVISIIITQMDDGSLSFMFADENGNEITLSQNAFISISYDGLTSDSVLFQLDERQRHLVGGRIEDGSIHFQTRTGGSFLIDENIAVFTDIANQSPETQHAIESLGARGVIPATPNRFNPGGSLSRAEATEWLVNALYMQDREHVVTFTDVPRTSPFFTSIAIGVAEEIIAGYPDNTFRPNQQITRQELLTITSNILMRERSYLQPADPLIHLGVSADEVSEWAKPFVAMAVRDGVITQSQVAGSNRNITRGEAALIIYSLFNRI